MNRAIHTKIPANPWAVFVCRNTPSPTCDNGSPNDVITADGASVTLTKKFVLFSAICAEFSRLDTDGGLSVVITQF